MQLLQGAAPLAEGSPHFVAWNAVERLRRPRPWTIAKWAQTRSGQLSPPPDVGGGRWISGMEAREEVQVLRGRVDAIVTGVSTVLHDNPRLTVRAPGDLDRPPLRIVLDSYLRTPHDARLFAPEAEGEAAGAVHVLCHAGASPDRARALRESGAELTGLPANEEDHLRLREVQTWAWEHGVRRMMIEAGPQLLGRYLEMGFVDQLRVYSGDVNGGEGASMAPWFGRLNMSGRLDRECGPDGVIEAFLLD